MKIEKGVYFVTGIDTNIGKSVATGWIAAQLQQQGVDVMTQKMIQTGNETVSEDIELHRKMMGIELTDEDKAGTTCPIIFTYPASPHLAAKIDNRTVDTSLITTATKQLAAQHDVLLLEGAGGAMVPLTPSLLTIDYVAALGYPTIVVTSGRLGSINHTILTIEAILHRGLPLYMVVYNRNPSTDKLIEDDTLLYLESYLQQVAPMAQLVVMDEIAL